MAVAFSTVLSRTGVVRPDGGWPEVEYIEPSPPRPPSHTERQEPKEAAAKTSRRSEASPAVLREVDDLGSRVWHETKNLRVWLESRLDDMSQDLRRVHQHQQQLLKSHEKVSRTIRESMWAEVSTPSEDPRELLHVPKRTFTPMLGPRNQANVDLLRGSTRSSSSHDFQVAAQASRSPRKLTRGEDLEVTTQHSRYPSHRPTRTFEDPEAIPEAIPEDEIASEVMPDGASRLVVSLGTDVRQPSTPPSTDSTLVPRQFSESMEKRARPAYSQPPMPDPGGASFLEEPVQHPHFPPFVVLPSSAFCLFWDLLGVVCLTYDLIVLPVVVAWELPSEGFVWFGSWSTVSFWTIDVILGFFKAVETDEKQVVYGRESILMYLKTWFFLDASVLGSDWLSLALELQKASNATTDLIKLFRILKLNRFVRLIRVVKMGRLDVLWDRASRLIWSMGMLGKLRILLRVSRFLVPGMLINHWCACIWYVVGKSFSESESDSWLRLLEAPGGGGAGQRCYFLEYASALQWSVSHMFGGSPVVMATNSAEHIFTVVNMVLGAICGSILISLVATLMMDLQNATLTRRKQLQEVRRFIHDNRVKPALASAILKQVRERTESHKRQHLKDVPIFTALSTQLWRELAYHVFSPPMFRTGFLFVCDSINTYCIKDICGTAVRELLFASHETVFPAGEHASHCYMFKTGSVVYYHQQAAAPIQTGAAVQEGNWLAEFALWLEWSYRGTAVAIRQSELLSLCVDEFVETLKIYSDVRALVGAYGRTLANCLSRIDSEVTDMPQDLVEEDTMLLLMPPDLRAMMSRPALEELTAADENWPSFTSFLRRKKSPLDLQDEVEKGNCLLKLTQAGTVYRLVSVAVLCLRDSDGRELIEMGKYNESGVVQPVCEYPATKARAGELPLDALHRLIAKDLPVLANCIVVEGSEVRVKEGASGSYGLPTKYLRTVFRAYVSDSDSPISSLKEIEWQKGGVRSQSTGSRLNTNFGTNSAAVTKLNSVPRLLKMTTTDIEPTVSDSFDLDHSYPAYHLGAASGQGQTGGTIFAFLMSHDFEDVQLNKQRLQPWLEDLTVGFFPAEDAGESSECLRAPEREDSI